MISIDGSYGEGGGQIVRMAVALSAMTGEPVKIFNIRHGRPRPGLKRQHITAIEAVAKLSNARVKGVREGSEIIEFYPGKIKGGEFKFDVGTAGSITLVLQACLPAAIFADKEVYIKVRGGTDVKWAPPWDYFYNVFLVHLSKMGCDIEAYLNERGYYPAGGGEVEVMIEPCELKPIKFEERIDIIRGIVNISKLPEEIAERIKGAAERVFLSEGMKAEIAIEETDSLSPGTGIVVWSEPKLLGADELGEKGKRAEEVGKNAAEKLMAEIKSNAELDERAVDQLLPYISMTGGKFKCREISNHAKTEMWLIKKFMDVEYGIEKNGLYVVNVENNS